MNFLTEYLSDIVKRYDKKYNTRSVGVAVLSFIFIISLTACSMTKTDISPVPQTKYEYPHQCTKNGDLVNHSINAKVLLSAKELNMLKATLQENMGLDYNSCIFVGDLDVINKNRS